MLSETCNPLAEAQAAISEQNKRRADSLRDVHQMNNDTTCPNDCAECGEWRTCRLTPSRGAAYLESVRRDASGIVEGLLGDSEQREQNSLACDLRLHQSLGGVTGTALLNSEVAAMETLLDPILPRCGIVSLVGSSDSGKSTLLRGLAIAVVSGASHYLGFALRPRYNRAIYLSTEDDERAIASLLTRQNEELRLPSTMLSNLYFMFDSEQVVERLDKALASAAVDLVVIDAFADLYSGPLNENNRVRCFLQQFHQVAIRHNTLIIFLHHTGKRTEALAPSKHNAIGSQGFEAKMRLMIELRKDPEMKHLRHLCIVKGNYLPAEFKHESFELRFTPHLNFEATGRRIPFDDLCESFEPQSYDKAEADRETYERIVALKEEGLSIREIASALGFKSHTSVLRRLKAEERAE